jgi:hypothetical protein
MTNEPDRLDLILNAAMRDYSNAEPRAGFEQRILQHVHPRHVQTMPHWCSEGSLAWALVVAAIVLIPLIVLPTRSLSPPVLALLPPPVPQVAHLPIPGPLRRRNSDHRSVRGSKSPEPLPLTAEERALLRLVQEQPEQAWTVLSQPAELQALTIEPLEIEELQ